MNVEIGAEAALFPVKEYINGIFVAVCHWRRTQRPFEGSKYYRTGNQRQPLASCVNETFCHAPVGHFSCTAKTKYWNSKQIFPEKEYPGLSPNFHVHASVRDLYISTNSLPILLEEICRPILGINKSPTDTWMWNWGWGRAIPRKGIHKWDFRCNVSSSTETKHELPITKMVLSSDAKMLSTSFFTVYGFNRQPETVRLWTVPPGPLHSAASLSPMLLPPTTILNFLNNSFILRISKQTASAGIRTSDPLAMSLPL